MLNSACETLEEHLIVWNVLPLLAEPVKLTVKKKKNTHEVTGRPFLGVRLQLVKFLKWKRPDGYFQRCDFHFYQATLLETLQNILSKLTYVPAGDWGANVSGARLRPGHPGTSAETGACPPSILQLPSQREVNKHTPDACQWNEDDDNNCVFNLDTLINLIERLLDDSSILVSILLVGDGQCFSKPVRLHVQTKAWTFKVTEDLFTPTSLSIFFLVLCVYFIELET